jgi:2,3-bisphosphoglycerate-dependent phosphoglycerate mutase
MVHSTLWLIRHGESTWNALGLAQGHCDQAWLTRRGGRQAWAVASELRSRPIGALYASDLRRALQTAAPLATVLGLPVTRDARLRERCLGVLEGTNSATIHPTASGLRAHRVVDAEARPPGGESLRDFYRRVAEFADDLAALPLAGDIAVVAHGGTVRVLNAYLRGIAVERMSWEPLANGCILRSPAWRLDHLTNPSERENR